MKVFEIENFATGFDDSVSDEYAGEKSTQDSCYVDYCFEMGAMQKDVGERVVGLTSISMSINYPFTGTVQRIYEGNIAVTDSGEFANKRLCIADGKAYQFCAGNQFIPLASGATLFGDYPEIPDVTHYADTFYITGGYDYALREWDGLTNSVSTNVAMEAGANRYRAKCTEVFRNRLFIANTNESTDSGATWNVSESRVRWSDMSFPNRWDAEDAGYVDANYVDILDQSGDEVVRLYRYQDVLLIFKKNSIHKLTFTGGALTFERTEIDSKSINNAPWTIDQTPLGVMFLNNEGLQRTDGNTVETIEADKKITTILRRAYRDSLGMAFGVANEPRQEYWLSLPLDGSSTCNYILVYNWKYNSWRIRKSDSTCLGLVTDEGSGTWQSIIDYYGYELIAYPWNSSFLYPGSKRVLIGRSDGYVRERSIAFNIDGSAYDSFHTTPWLDLGLPGQYKEVVKIQPMWQGTSGDSVTVKVKSDTDTSFTTITSDDFAATGITEQPFLWMRKLGRKFRFMFENNNANENYRIYKMKIFFETRDWR